MTISPRVTILSTVKTKKSSETEENKSKPTTALIGIQTTSAPTPDTTTCSETGPLLCADDDPSIKGVRDAFLGVPDVNELLLPDLGTSSEPTTDDIIKQTLGSMGEHSQEPMGSVDEQDAVDALLSLSTMPTSSNLDLDYGIEDNALLAPIGGQVICEDVAPTESRLGQLEVDNQIAHLIAQEEHEDLAKEQSQSASSTLIGVPPPDIDENTKEKSTSAEDKTSDKPKQDASDTLNPPTDDPDVNKGARPKTTNKDPNTEDADKPGSRGAFKSQLYGLRRSHPKDRAYKCQVCGKSKRSMEDLNIHHQRNHNPQRCGVFGKMFDLVASLVHHMYSHYTRKYHCDKCDFH